MAIDRNNDPFGASGTTIRPTPRPMGTPDRSFGQTPKYAGYAAQSTPVGAPGMTAPPIAERPQSFSNPNGQPSAGIAPGENMPAPMGSQRTQGPIGNTMLGANTYRNQNGFAQYNSPHSEAAAEMRARYGDSPLARAAETAAGTPPQRDNVLETKDMNQRMYGMNGIASRQVGQDYYTRENEMHNALVGVDSPLKRAAIMGSMRRGYNAQDQSYYGAMNDAFNGQSNLIQNADNLNSGNMRNDANNRVSMDNSAFQAGTTARGQDMTYDNFAANRADSRYTTDRQYQADRYDKAFGLENELRQEAGLPGLSGESYYAGQNPDGTRRDGMGAPQWDTSPEAQRGFDDKKRAEIAEKIKNGGLPTPATEAAMNNLPPEQRAQMQDATMEQIRHNWSQGERSRNAGPVGWLGDFFGGFGTSKPALASLPTDANAYTLNESILGDGMGDVTYTDPQGRERVIDNIDQDTYNYLYGAQQRSRQPTPEDPLGGGV